MCRKVVYYVNGGTVGCRGFLIIYDEEIIPPRAAVDDDLSATHIKYTVTAEHTCNTLLLLLDLEV